MALLFTADTHFNHRAILQYCNRPFDSIEEMNEALIDNWNSVVRPKDEVWHLGDLIFVRSTKPALKEIRKLMDRLNGRKHLILGNHDRKKVLMKAGGLASIDNLKRIKYAKRSLVLCHYALRVWRGSYRHKTYCLYGHSHGRLPLDIPLALDVGVDTWNYYPVSFEQIDAKMKELWPEYFEPK